MNKKTTFRFNVLAMLIVAVIFINLSCVNVFAATPHDPFNGIIPARFDGKNGAAGNVVAGAAGGVHAVRNGEWAVYKDVYFDSSPIMVEVVCSTDEGNKGEMQLRLDSPTGPLIASIKTKPEGWSVNTLYRIPVSIEFTGKHDIYYVGKGGACDTHSIKFYKGTATNNYLIFDGADSYVDISGSPYKFEISSVSALGLIKPKDSSYFDPNIPVTRGELASVVYNIIGIDSGEVEKAFADVSEDYEYSQQINQLFNMGIVKGNSASNFLPNEFATPEQAVLMLTRVLAYDMLYSKEEYKEFSNDMPDYKLMRGVSDEDISDVLRKDVLAKLVYNAINSDYYSLDTIGQKGNTYKKIKGILCQTKGIYMSEGVVWENSSSNIYDVDSVSKKGYVVIEGEKYATAKTNADKYLGVKCEYYYRVENGENVLAAIIPANDISVKKFTSLHDEIISISDSLIEYEAENGKKKELNVSKGASILYNGKVIDDKLSDLIGNGEFQGEVICISNNNSKIADVVFVEQYVNIKVKNIDISGEKIIDEFSGEAFPIDSNDTILVLKKDGESYFADSIEKGDIATVYCSKNTKGQKICRIYITTNHVEGIATEIADDEVIIDGSKYTISNECIDEIKLGVTSVFTLNIYNEVICCKISDNKEMLLGALVDRCVDGQAFSKKVLAKIFTANAMVEQFEFADKVIIDGVSCKNLDEVYNGVGTFDGLKSVRLKTPVKYKLNSENKIVILDTHMTANGDKYDTLKDLTGGRKNLTYVVEHGMFLNGGLWQNAITNDAKVIQFWNHNEESITYSDIYTALSYEASLTVPVELYSTDPDSEVADIIMLYDVSSFQNKGYLILVDKVKKTMDTGTEMETYVVEGVCDGRSFSITMNPYTLDINNSKIRKVVEDLKKGDLVIIGRDSDNKGCTAHLQFIHDGSEYTSNGTQAYRHLNTDYTGLNTCDIMLGTVEDIDNGYAKVIFGNNPARGYEYVNLKYATISCYDYNGGHEILTPRISIDNILPGDKVVFYLYGGNKAFVYKHPSING